MCLTRAEQKERTTPLSLMAALLLMQLRMTLALSLASMEAVSQFTDEGMIICKGVFEGKRVVSCEELLSLVSCCT